MKTTLHLTPHDTLFFRDGRPFERNDESWARGIFPPPPTVFRGALRSWYLVQDTQRITALNEKRDPTEKISIRAWYLWDTKKKERLFIPPADLLRNEEGAFFHLQLTENVLTSAQSSHVLAANEKKPEVLRENYLLTEEGFEAYLSGTFPQKKSEGEKYLRPLSETLIDEPKVGIGRNNRTHVSEEGQLYRVGMQRLKNTAFEIGVDWGQCDPGLSAGKTGILKLGGEGKTVNFEVAQKNPTTASNPSSSFKEGELFKVYVQTPVIFHQGWLPDFLDQETHEGVIKGVGKVRLLSAALDKPKSVGGFDMKKREPKRMLRAVPEGAVYFFEALEKINLPRFLNWQEAINETNYKQDGFGQIYIAKVADNQKP